MKPTTFSRSSLAGAALAGIAAFPVIVVALHVVQAGSYHPINQAVSELALGRAGWLMALAFCSLATGTLLLATTLRRLDPKPRVGPWLIGASALPTYASAFVHADGAGPTTTHGAIHQLLGVASFILMIAGMFTLSRAFRRDPDWQPMSRPTLVWALAAVAIFFLIPIAGPAHFGLAQRIFIGVILSWAIATSARAQRAHTDRHDERVPAPASSIY